MDTSYGTALPLASSTGVVAEAPSAATVDKVMAEAPLQRGFLACGLPRAIPHQIPLWPYQF
jgi:hypothetical protein